MADAEEKNDGEENPPKKSKKPMLVGLALALMLGGGGFYAVYSGMVLGSQTAHPTEDVAHGAEPARLPPIAFVPVAPLVISLGTGSATKHLRFRAELEVEPAYEEDVKTLVPRVLDVLNSYLRAVELSDLENPSALVNLRAQMLRRIQIVAGEGRVRDLLIMEFVLN